ncbi:MULTISPECIES: group II intron maturase-specific domain-containing protein [unclassified Oceanobacillus]|uniref:group II intron maturase-specific domain-containing protein n=1 Tax=unclassified Oceanobacillus TaxID=2630292 RepID=UPI00300E1DF6
MRKLKQVIYGWVNYFKIANMKVVLGAIDSKLRSRLRASFGNNGRVVRKELNHWFNLVFRKGKLKA